MPFRFLSDTHGKLRGALNIFLYAVATAVVTLALAGLISGSQADLAQRVDNNAAIARSGVDTIVCILLQEPENRTDESVIRCAVANGYRSTPTISAP